MNRRQFLREAPLKTAAAVVVTRGLLSLRLLAAETASPGLVDPAIAKDWLARWEKNILGDGSANRYCDKEMGEELGWLVSPFLEGFYHGYRATGDPKWVALLVDWMDSCLKRGVTEPDGFTGWPKAGTGGLIEDSLFTDSLLGEAMLLRPVVLMAGEILKTPALAAQWGPKAHRYLDLAEKTFAKWDARGCWREVKDGGVWVVPAFGLDPAAKAWTAGYDQRTTTGFSNPANKQNLIALWLLALADVTGKPVYRDRAEKWWRVMKSRIRTQGDGKFLVWNYWDPAGPWDHQPDGSTRHWVGVHPNGGYYGIDAEGITTAFERGLVFTPGDFARLVATNRDFMWNQQVKGAKFQSIGGGPPDPRWQDAPGVLWTALVPHDAKLREVFVANHDPASWGGLAVTPWFLALGKGA